MEPPTPGDAPAIFTVRYSKLRLLGALAALLTFAAVMTWFLPHLPRGGVGPVVMRVVTAFLLGLLCAFVLRSLCWVGPVVRVDEAGVYDARGVYPRFEWADIVAAHAMPKHEEAAPGALRLTVRHPDKYRLWAGKLILPGIGQIDQVHVFLNFSCLTPDAVAVAQCIQQHLARTGSGREQEQPLA